MQRALLPAAGRRDNPAANKPRTKTALTRSPVAQFNILQLNCNGITGKSAELAAYLLLKDIKIALIQESKLGPQSKDECLDLIVQGADAVELIVMLGNLEHSSPGNVSPVENVFEKGDDVGPFFRPAESDNQNSVIGRFQRCAPFAAITNHVVS